MSRGRTPKKGSDYYLPEETYRMVQHFCYAYYERKTEAMALVGLKSPVIDDMPHGTGSSDPTARDGARLAELERKNRIIEEAVKAVSPGGNWWLFKTVTDKRMGYRVLRDKYGCPYGPNQFWRMKRMVYWKVSKEI